MKQFNSYLTLETERVRTSGAWLYKRGMRLYTTSGSEWSSHVNYSNVSKIATTWFNNCLSKLYNTSEVETTSLHNTAPHKRISDNTYQLWWKVWQSRCKYFNLDLLTQLVLLHNKVYDFTII